MHRIVLITTKKTIFVARLLAMNCDEVMTMDNQSQVNIQAYCRNPSLELVTKARACKNEGQQGSPGVTCHAPGSAKECEGMNPHTPKGTPTLGVGVSVDS